MPDIKQLTDAGDELDALLIEKEKVAASLEALEKKIENLQSVTLPALMADANLMSFVTQAGRRMDLIWVYNAKIPEAKWGDAVDYLEKSGNTGIIKNRVEALFPMNQNEAANMVAKELEDRGFTVKREQNIHPRTLVSFVKEKIEKGEADSTFDDIFGVVRIQRVTTR